MNLYDSFGHLYTIAVRTVHVPAPQSERLSSWTLEQRMGSHFPVLLLQLAGLQSMSLPLQKLGSCLTCLQESVFCKPCQHKAKFNHHACLYVKDSHTYLLFSTDAPRWATQAQIQSTLKYCCTRAHSFANLVRRLINHVGIWRTFHTFVIFWSVWAAHKHMP
jgi:hypothetical protein